MFPGSLAPLRLISIITYSGSSIQRRRYPEVAIKGINKKARETRRGNTQESECMRGSSVVLFAPEELESGTRGSSFGFKADDLYCVGLQRFCGGTLKSKGEKLQG